MNPTQNKYPVFKANQVLTHDHLNHAIEYLDEQERLTRANLMGIGIVCGLEITYTETSITISKGCGITSEGYLLIEPNNVELLSYRKYESPTELAYSQFKNKELWELLPSSSESSNLDKDFLSDKVVLLFLELTNKDMCNCSPTDCVDKGTEIIVTVKRLLICKDSIPEATADLISCKHELFDLRLPRYSLSENDSTTSGVLKTFHNVFCTNQLVTKLEQSLTTAYSEFKPILQNNFPEDPFTKFKLDFGFLEDDDFDEMEINKKPFLQYYYGFFDDLIKAYDEFIWKATALSCACRPSEELFPRHLMLGLTSKTASGEYRQNFLASLAINNYEEDRKDVVQLFKRLVKMINQFSDSPLEEGAKLQIRITPSKLGDVPLSEKAIPYYYKLNDQTTEPLFKQWNAKKTQRNLAHENLSYHWDEYNPVPDFISHPLRYDLESSNFLRIEGHLGKKRQEVEEELLKIKEKYRLPIEIIALPTGQSLQNFLKNHPRIQHKAGVSLGGTFILVYDDASNVIADFFLPYRVKEHQCNCIKKVMLVLLTLGVILVALLYLLDIETKIALVTLLVILLIANEINGNGIVAKLRTVLKKKPNTSGNAHSNGNC